MSDQGLTPFAARLRCNKGDAHRPAQEKQLYRLIRRTSAPQDVQHRRAGNDATAGIIARLASAAARGYYKA
jgi:hypothetical protein